MGLVEVATQSQAHGQQERRTHQARHPEGHQSLGAVDNTGPPTLAATAWQFALTSGPLEVRGSNTTPCTPRVIVLLGSAQVSFLVQFFVFLFLSKNFSFERHADLKYV
jgi:hypothetical protein